MDDEPLIKDVIFIVLSVFISQPFHNLMLFSFAEFLDPRLLQRLDLKNNYKLKNLYQGMVNQKN